MKTALIVTTICFIICSCLWLIYSLNDCDKRKSIETVFSVISFLLSIAMFMSTAVNMSSWKSYEDGLTEGIDKGINATINNQIDSIIIYKINYEK